MGAGKSTLGGRAASRLERPFTDVDFVVENHAKASIAEIWEREGEEAFRAYEEQTTLKALRAKRPAVIALGGGAVQSAAVRDLLRDRALTVLLDVSVDDAWRRARDGSRPLARDETRFRELYHERAPLYRDVADVHVQDEDGIVLAAGGIHVEPGSLERLGELVPGSGPVELVSDARVAGIYGMDAQLALGARSRAIHELPPGESAKSVESLETLWNALRLGRDGTLVALGGGCTTDVAGFAAATYLRGIDWVAVPTTLVGQVDAAIGGKTAIDLSAGKNLAGAFHWPVRTVIDESLLATLSEHEVRQGHAELVKTRLLAGAELDVRGAAAFKTAICLCDPHDRGARAILNLGHTFAHALEFASGFSLAHGDAVALGLLAALRLSGNDDGVRVVEHELAPRPVRVDRDRAWAALQRDKKAVGGTVRLVLLPVIGDPIRGVDLPAEDVRRALDELIAG